MTVHVVGAGVVVVVTFAGASEHVKVGGVVAETVSVQFDDEMTRPVALAPAGRTRAAGTPFALLVRSLIELG